MSGRLVEVHGDRAKVELGEGVIATCQLKEAPRRRNAANCGSEKSGRTLSSLSAMLSARWKQGGRAARPVEGSARGTGAELRIATLDAG